MTLPAPDPSFPTLRSIRQESFYLVPVTSTAGNIAIREEPSGPLCGSDVTAGQGPLLGKEDPVATTTFVIHLPMGSLSSKYFLLGHTCVCLCKNINYYNDNLCNTDHTVGVRAHV